MSIFRIGRIERPWIDIEPPISRTAHTRHTEKTTAETRVGDAAAEKYEITSAKPAVEQWLAEHSAASRMESDGKLSRQEALRALELHEIDAGSHDYPPMDAAGQRGISDKFQKLHEEVRAQGLYTCKASSYMKELIRYCILFGLFVTTFRHGWYLLSAVCLGAFWHQIMFTAHDAGHLAITHNFKMDTALGIFIADFCCGLSMGWWKSSHNVHHLVPNHIVS